VKAYISTLKIPKIGWYLCGPKLNDQIKSLKWKSLIFVKLFEAYHQMYGLPLYSHIKSISFFWKVSPIFDGRDWLCLLRDRSVRKKESKKWDSITLSLPLPRWLRLHELREIPRISLDCGTLEFELPQYPNLIQSRFVNPQGVVNHRAEENFKKTSYSFPNRQSITVSIE